MGGRSRRVGDPRLPERFWRKVAVDAATGCWLWGAHVDKHGYGDYRSGTATTTYTRHAHRAAYVELVGPIPRGLVIDHLCRVRRCVNPSHMEVVTHQTNILRGVGPAAKNAVKQLCPRGHPLSSRGANRVCLECERARVARGRRIAKAIGFCVACKKEAAAAERRMCVLCRDRQRAYIKEWRARRGRTSI